MQVGSTGGTVMGAGPSRANFEIGRLFNDAWNSVSANAGVLIGGCALIVVVQSALNSFTWGIVYLAIAGPLHLGYCDVILRILRGRRVEFVDLFSGFQRFVPAFMANLLITLFAAIAGILTCGLGSLVVLWLYMLVWFFMADRGEDFWPAMESSRKTVMADLGPWLVLGLAIVGINIVGALACGVGLILSIPLTLVMLGLAYEQTCAGAAGSGPSDAPGETASL